MKPRGYLLWAFAAVLITLTPYVLMFGGMDVSAHPSDWGVFGEYLGGVLSAALSFLTVLLLVESIGEQSRANAALELQLLSATRESRLRTFEGLFFELLRGVGVAFDELRIEDGVDAGNVLHGSKAVEYLEDQIATIVSAGPSSECAKVAADYLAGIDRDDKLHACLRTFELAARLVQDVLTEDQLFTPQDRKRYYRLLLGRTSFPGLRLVLLLAQFVPWPHAKSLIENAEFVEELRALGLLDSQYPCGRNLGSVGRVRRPRQPKKPRGPKVDATTLSRKLDSDLR